MPVSKKISAETLSLRITVVDPPPNILWALQLGQDEVVKANLEHQESYLFRLYSGGNRRFLHSGIPPSRSGGSGAPWRALRISAHGRLRRPGRCARRLARQDWARRDKPQVNKSGEGEGLGRVGSSIRRHGAQGWSGLRNRATVETRLAPFMKRFGSSLLSFSRAGSDNDSI